MHRGIIGAAVIVALIVMIYIAGIGMSEHVVPSFGEYISSSTPAIATSSAQVASSTVALVPFYAPKTTLRVQIAKTPTTREQGLSGRDSLASDEGLLFIFPEQGKHGFWMKDMYFPIDIVWIRSDRVVVGVSENISPDTYPQTFYPPSDIQFVLEIPAGSATSAGLKKGSAVDF